mmetsp:Transcript_20654/g.46851  ORF Transcript_20654/g.46851 Transcript_20654/m.46851 type:complete len:91 (+) Transcript_20654:138-410(+)
MRTRRHEYGRFINLLRSKRVSKFVAFDAVGVEVIQHADERKIITVPDAFNDFVEYITMVSDITTSCNLPHATKKKRIKNLSLDYCMKLTT